MIKLLIGGSPCTYWSIAQTNNRETKAEGVGWELFKNYLIAKEKFKPDLFLYENNKSATPAIKDQISAELGVPLMYINSALVSAQNRQRFYAFNWSVEQPRDRKITLVDILESSTEVQERAYSLTAIYGDKGSSEAHLSTEWVSNYVLQPARIGTIKSDTVTLHDSQSSRVYSPYGKSVTLLGNAGGAGAKTGLYAVPCDPGGIFPINTTRNGKSQTIKSQYGKNSLINFVHYKSTYGATGVAESIRKMSETNGHPIYEVIHGEIEIRGRKYPINLPDGLYIIRKLTVTECCRLQTLPDDYCCAVSPTQAYKGLGNGWTAEVIIHILNGALWNVPRDEEIVCLSMYDGIGTGRYCLNKMGFQNVRYYAYEIDKYAMKVANSNFPDIIQRGDAFDVRRDGWEV